MDDSDFSDSESSGEEEDKVWAYSKPSLRVPIATRTACRSGH